MFLSLFQGRRGVYLSALGAGVVLAAGVVAAADSSADPVFNKVRSAVQANVAETRGIACMASVERTRYLPRVAARPASCAESLASLSGGRQGAVAWRNRERLDVTAGATGESFAFTEVTPFERTDIASLLHDAGTQSGEFSDFLRNVIATGGATFQPVSLQQTPLGKLLAMGFTTSGGAGKVAWSGSLFVLPESGDPRRLTLQAENTGSACRVQYTIDYAATRVGDRQYVLPQSSIRDSIDPDGSELHSETYYSSCRKTGSPAVNVAPAPVTRPLPAGTRFRVKFQPPIDGETAAIGDPVVGVIRTTVKDKQTGLIVHAGDRIHGRIALIEQFQQPQKRWNLAVVFETIERGVGDHGIDQGVEQSVSLIPLDDGDRFPHDEILTPEQLQKLRPAGGAYFVFHDNNIVLDQRFETEWETR